jgi:hypothetical protein
VIHLTYIAAYDWGRYWQGALGRTFKDECDLLLLFRRSTGWNYHRSNVRARLLALDYDLSFVSTETTSGGLSVLSRSVKAFNLYTNNSVDTGLVVTYWSCNHLFLDSSWRLIRNQRKNGLRILSGCFCRVPPSFALQINSWTSSWRMRALCFLPYMSGIMVKQLAIHYFSSRTTQRYVGLCI